MWANLPAGGVDRNKIDQQPNAMLLELWRQLRPEQQFTKCGKHPQKEIQVVYLEDYMVPMDVASHVLFHFEWGSGQCANLNSPRGPKAPCRACNSLSQANAQRAMALVDSVVECSLICYAKSLQLCPTLCDPIDGSPPGSPVPGILEARTCVAISFSTA